MSEYYNPEVQQLYPDTCAIKSQQLILKDFGIDVSETELVQAANANGWYNGGGTSPEDVGNLLNLAGIPVSKQSDANVFNLVNELAQGHEVIVGVDADELWHNSSINEKLSNWFNDVFGEQGGNHALIVAGIDTRDPNNIQVIVKDPGSGHRVELFSNGYLIFDPDWEPVEWTEKEFSRALTAWGPTDYKPYAVPGHPMDSITDAYVVDLDKKTYK